MKNGRSVAEGGGQRQGLPARLLAGKGGWNVGRTGRGANKGLYRGTVKSLPRQKRGAKGKRLSVGGS